ncbi:class I SAM-dependent methyltransferase [Candidatus Microgenomates bacterium]|nr:class I SAM-dependent methyltransferase [Candidatus Microgenomates bacterium]
MSIEQQLNLKFPIYWNDSAVEEKYLIYLIYKIIVNRPINIVELGSGISSLVIIKTLEKLGYSYNFFSVDSDALFLEETKKMLISEGVYDEKKVKLIFSPITDITIDGNIYKWYRWSDFNFNFERIDLLFVDGPQGSLCKNARYPAMHILGKYLKKGSMVLLHDAKREDETEIVESWERENLIVSRVYKIETERGGAELHFDKPRQNHEKATVFLDEDNQYKSEKHNKAKN